MSTNINTKSKDYIEFEFYVNSCVHSEEYRIYNVLKCFSNGSWRVVFNDNLPAAAAINTSSYRVEFNPKHIAYILYPLRKELKIDGYIYDETISKQICLVCRYITTFLVLHELGHWLYTADSSTALSYAQQYCSHMPVELCMFLFNAVEDSIIERLFMLEYRGNFYRKAFDLGICIFQGGEAIKTFVSEAEEQKWSIRIKLFYFIVRAYNLHNKEVQNMFNLPDKLGWKQDTLEAFDNSIIIIDKNDRCKFIFETLAPLVFRDLLEEVDGTGSSPASPGSLLNQDKLYKAKNEEQESSKSGASQGQSNSSNQNQQSQSSLGNGESSDSKEESNETSSGNDSGESSKESNEDKNSSNGSSEEEESSNESKEQSSSGGDGNSNSDNDSNSNCSGGTTSEEEELPEVKPTESSVESTIEEIKEACKELNASINAANKPEEMTKAPKLKPQGNPLASSCEVKDHSSHLKSSSTSLMEDLTLEIYGNALNVLDKIFTMSDSTLRGLDQGELDEDELYTYFTEKNLNIYKEDIKLKQDKKVVCYFILDNSGSMSGSRFDYSSAAFVGLIHALEDIQIKCCFLTFGQTTRLIKNFDDSISFLGTASPLQEMVDSYVANLESDTNLYPALDYVINDKPFLSNDPDLCKVVIVATDGATNNEAEVAGLAEKISADALMFGVGLDMSRREAYLQRIMPGAIIRNYCGKDIASKLPQDIYEEIINKFLLY